MFSRAAKGRISFSTSRCRSEYGGWSAPAVIATLVGCALAWGGLVIPALRPLYDYAWFVGFLVAGRVYLSLKRRPTVPAASSEPA